MARIDRERELLLRVESLQNLLITRATGGDADWSEYKVLRDEPRLYKLTSESLNLGPSQYTEKVFKQILGGCTTVVEGLGAIRNRLGDAHGQGKLPVKPATRHAELAVNLAGAMALFLVDTWEHVKSGSGA